MRRWEKPYVRVLEPWETMYVLDDEIPWRYRIRAILFVRALLEAEK